MPKSIHERVRDTIAKRERDAKRKLDKAVAARQRSAERRDQKLEEAAIAMAEERMWFGVDEDFS